MYVLWLVSCSHFSWFHPLFITGWWLNWWRRDRLRPDKGWAQQQPHADTAQGGDEEVPESVGHKAALLGSQEKHGRSSMILSGYMFLSMIFMCIVIIYIYIYICIYIIYICVCILCIYIYIICICVVYIYYIYIYMYHIYIYLLYINNIYYIFIIYLLYIYYIFIIYLLYIYYIYITYIYIYICIIYIYVLYICII